MKTTKHAVIVAGICAVVGGTTVASAATYTNTFANRDQVNLMNSPSVSVSSAQQAIFPGIDAGNLRGNWIEGFWDGGSNPPGGTNYITVNFGQTRNIKTLHVNNFGSSAFDAATVQTSTDGINWTTQSATLTSPNSTQRDLVLSSAANAQYLRLTATDIQDGNGLNRWVVNSLRVFGGTGTMIDPGNSLDLVNTGGGVGGNVSLSLNGSVGITDTTTSEYVNDALNPIKRAVLFNMGTGDGFTLAFNNFVIFDRIGLFQVNAEGSASPDVNADWMVETSPDGSTWNSVLTQTTFPLNLNYYSLTPSEGKYVRFTLTSTTSSDIRISDVQVFGALPEPSAAVLFALGGLAMWWRRRGIARR
jgi:hypothetical protein